MENDLARLHAIVEGRVQGVGFRYFVQEEATRIGLQGWVRNRFDGNVEILAEGERKALERMLGLIRRGPPSAIVSGVQITWLPATGEFISFRVRMTE